MPTAPFLSDAAVQLEAGKHRYQDKFCGGHLRGKKPDYREHCRGDACRNFAPAQLIEIRRAQQIDDPGAIPARRAGPCAETSIEPGLPLVSCIMPTCNRRAFIPAALACFAAQDYPRLELIVVDDGSDSVADLMPADSRIRYFRLDGKRNIGVKRNLACEQARGSFIAHWDDDDWYPPSRIRKQIEAMRGAHWQVSGSTTMFYLHPDKDQAFRYAYTAPGCAWLGALLYARSAWSAPRSSRFSPAKTSGSSPAFPAPTALISATPHLPSGRSTPPTPVRKSRPAHTGHPSRRKQSVP